MDVRRGEHCQSHGRQPFMLVCIVAAGLSFAGCTAAPDPVRIGVLLPAGGPLAVHSRTASRGRWMR